jgi:hypothetical protein
MTCNTVRPQYGHRSGPSAVRLGSIDLTFWPLEAPAVSDLQAQQGRQFVRSRKPHIGTVDKARNGGLRNAGLPCEFVVSQPTLNDCRSNNFSKGILHAGMYHIWSPKLIRKCIEPI